MAKKFLLMMVLFLVVAAGCQPPEKKPPQGEAHFMLGLSHFRQQQLTQALKEFILAVEADPQNPNFHNALAQAYQLKKAYPEAEKHYLKAIELSANSPEYQNNVGALYLDMQRWDDAIKYFRLAAANLLFGNPEVALAGIGFAHFQKGEYLDAVTAYQEAIKHNSRFSIAHLRLGETYYELSKWPLAIESFREVTVLVPDYPEGFFKLGLAYMKNGQKEEARQAFAEVVRLAPVSESAKLAKGYIELLQ